MILRWALGIAGSLAVAWLVLILVLARARPTGSVVVEAARILPDTIRLLRRLARDQALPRGVRVRLLLLIAYLVFPLDLVPDFIPVVGHLDDVIIVALALRSVVRRAGAEALERHWKGSPAGLAAVRRLAGLPSKA